MKRYQLFLGLVLLISIAAGYRIADYMLERQKEVKPPEPIFSYTLDEKIQAKLPKSYPSYVVPIMPGAKLLAASKRTSPDDKKDFYSVVIATDRNLAETVNYYENALKKRVGYNKSGAPKYIFLKGSRGSKFFTVSIAAGEVNKQKKTIVTIIINPKPKNNP